MRKLQMPEKYWISKLMIKPLPPIVQVAEQEAETAHLKSLVPNLTGLGQSGFEGCVNARPVDLAQEIGVYRKILDAVEDTEEGKSEDICKR